MLPVGLVYATDIVMSTFVPLAVSPKLMLCCCLTPLCCR